MAEDAPGDLPPDQIGDPPEAGPSVIGAAPDEPGMWLTASAWLPAALLNALGEGAPADGNHALQAAFRQAGPLDEMPPGPVLTAFLSECSAPAASESGTSGDEPGRPAAEPGPTSSASGGAGRAGVPEPLAARISSG